MGTKTTIMPLSPRFDGDLAVKIVNRIVADLNLEIGVESTRSMESGLLIPELTYNVVTRTVRDHYKKARKWKAHKMNVWIKGV